VARPRRLRRRGRHLSGDPRNKGAAPLRPALACAPNTPGPLLDRNRRPFPHPRSRGFGGISSGRGGVVTSGPGGGITSGPGCGMPGSTSGAGAPGGMGGRTTSGLGSGRGFSGVGVMRLLSRSRG
jgi:hypothetical protein